MPGMDGFTVAERKRVLPGLGPLRAARRDPPSTGHGSAAEQGRRRLRVLVAEDNGINQLLMRRLIEKVVMDVQMPELDGRLPRAVPGRRNGRLPDQAREHRSEE